MQTTWLTPLYAGLIGLAICGTPGCGVEATLEATLADQADDPRLATLNACALPSTCGSVVYNAGPVPYPTVDELDCLTETLSEEQPAHLSIVTVPDGSVGDCFRRREIFVGADGTAWVWARWEGTCPETRSLEPELERCTLADRGYFEECVAQGVEQPNGTFNFTCAYGWFDNCEPAETATCPS